MSSHPSPQGEQQRNTAQTQCQLGEGSCDCVNNINSGSVIQFIVKAIHHSSVTKKNTKN